MFTTSPNAVEFSEAWIESDGRGRWRSATGHGPGTGAEASGSSILEIDAGCRLPRHTDSAEEVIVIASGSATVTVAGERATLAEGAIALVPAGVPHEVTNADEGPLHFWAIYADAEVTTTYEEPVQPDGGRERNPVA